MNYLSLHHSILSSCCLLPFFKILLGRWGKGKTSVNWVLNSFSCIQSGSVSWLIVSLVIIINIWSGVSAQGLCSKPGKDALWKETEKACEQSFAYCMKGKKTPLLATCPKNLGFNPGRGKCEKEKKCQSALKAQILAPPTKKKGPPPKENEEECPTKECGLYPGEECPSYYICSGGIKVWKNCTGNNIFDVKTNECKDPQQGVCWQKISKMIGTGEKLVVGDQGLYCPFHNRTASASATPAKTRSSNDPTGVILASPQLTNYGEWQEWSYCKPGSYFAGIQMWRRSTDADGGRHDHAGITSIGFACEFPMNPGESEVIGQYAPGSPDKKWYNFLRCSLGTTIGFQLSQQAEQGPDKDDLATDSVRVFCSCGKDPVLAKKYHEPRPEYIKVGGLRGNWTDELICGRKQAMCAFQTQMQAWKKTPKIDYDKGDMTGLNQVRIKCCDVPSPAYKCDPVETRHFLETCDNLESEYNRDCAFEAIVGIDYNQTAELKQSVSFYEGIGHSIEDALEDISSSFQSKQVECASFKPGEPCAFKWGANMEPDLEERFFRRGEIETGETAVKSGIKAHIYQVVATCGVFTVYTNQLIKVRVNKEGQMLKKEIIENF